MDYDLVVAEVDHLLVGVVAEADNSFESFRLQLFRVDGREHFLQTAANHLGLSIVAEVVKDDEWVFKGEAEGLSPVVDHVFHPAIVDNAERHFSAPDLYESDVVACIAG